MLGATVLDGAVVQGRHRQVGEVRDERVEQVAGFVRTHHDAAYVPISAKIESELIDLPPDEAKAFLKEFKQYGWGAAL